ncbi:hypothetical protein B0H12DRAFT_517714 [Mycena haematopus]|nr:hypothetical protein B0H12DRAFT_517714 [Mycena haematopus]
MIAYHPPLFTAYHSAAGHYPRPLPSRPLRPSTASRAPKPSARAAATYPDTDAKILSIRACGTLCMRRWTYAHLYLYLPEIYVNFVQAQLYAISSTERGVILLVTCIARAPSSLSSAA